MPSAVGENLEARVDAERAPGHVFDLSRDVFAEAGLVLGQHFQHGPQVEPPLYLGHAVPERQTRRQSFFKSKKDDEGLRHPCVPLHKGDRFHIEHTKRTFIGSM